MGKDSAGLGGDTNSLANPMVLTPPGESLHRLLEFWSKAMTFVRENYMLLAQLLA